MTAKANVWQVGKVMYDLFSLSGQEKYESLQAKSGHEYHEVNRHDTLPNWVTTPFVEDLYRQKSPYSTKLSETISRLIRDYFRLLEPANNDPEEPRLNIHPEQTRDTLVGLEDSEDDIAIASDRELEDQIKAYDWRNHEVQQGRIRRHDSRILFENIQPDRPPSPNKSYSSSIDTNSDKDEDFDNISKRDMKRRRLNSIANWNRIASRQLRERKKQERQAVEWQLQAAEQQRQEAELPSNTSHTQVDRGDHESRTPARGMTPTRHIEEMGQAWMPPTTSITTQAPANGQPRPRPGLDHPTPDIAPSRPDWARFGLSPSSGVFEQDALLEVYGADTVQAVPPTGATDPNYVSPRTLTALHKRAGFPPESNRPRPVATPGVVRPSYKRDKSQHEAGTSVFRRANVPQEQQDDPIPSLKTNHPSGNAVAQTSRADARGVGVLTVSSALDRAPSVTRVRTPSDDPKTSRVLRSL
ncbi:hypothetical protein LTR70_006347 [Exophiala xenobiotica]|uniref:Protein kinase domain-containing protein n=1 Tax=Lithohypha guttulata TaxID=1690604 RepID=A0ABR0K8B4_9EURO|nr:hypothetical protein LTR24_005816 [Lithohypha guttulata]KAK5316292.1 hypothetical protein LTR70_006347 [Exophiala xenobiotica]